MRRRRLALAATAVALVVSGLAAGEPSGATASAQLRGYDRSAAPESVPTAQLRGNAQPPQLRRKGRWLVDRNGRVVILHGLNLVWKHDPYVPPATAAGFTARDANWLERHGFNMARIGTLWAGITPDAPGRADPTYRQKWQRVMDLLSQRGIWMQLDAHQDQFHETYGGEGVPDWALTRPLPYAAGPPPSLPFPTNYWTPEVSTVFDNFWANQDGVLDGWVRSWEIAARWWRRQPHLMGYDLINEPWAGREWPTCLDPTGCPAFYTDELQPALVKATRAIRRIDGDNLVWWEPQQFAGGRPIDTYFTALRGERQLGFSWHNYCPEVFLESQGLPGADVEKCLEYSRGRHEHALDQARRMNAAPLMSEWGATDNVRAVRLDAQAADESLMGWTHWAYKRWNDPTTADDAQGLFRDDADLTSVKRAKVRVLVRTYAQATAGTPLRMRFSPATGGFDYRYRPNRSIDAPTVVFVSPLHYPHGYRVVVDGGRVVRRDARHLYVRPTGSGREVRVRIVPRRGN